MGLCDQLKNSLQLPNLQHVAIIKGTGPMDALTIKKCRKSIIDALQIIAHAGPFNNNIAYGKLTLFGQILLVLNTIGPG